MRHKGVDKEQTRRKMIAATVRGFKKNGYSGIGVDGLAKAAGVTSGAFYSHFGSKSGAFEISLEAGLDEVIDGIPKFQIKHGTDWVIAFTEYYLGKPHLNDLESSCAMATLTSEVVRSDTKIHSLYDKKMSHITNLISQGLAGNSDEDRQSRAWSMLATLIGGINIVRAMKNTKATEAIIESMKTSAIKAAGRTRSTMSIRS